MTATYRAAILVASCCWATSALAAETITYGYDAQGRLITVIRTGSVNNGITDDYSYDKAHNRVVAKVTGAATPGP